MIVITGVIAALGPPGVGGWGSGGESDGSGRGLVRSGGG